MRITPLDIQQKQFKVRFRGFDMEEVYSFLEIIRETLEEILKENAILKEKVALLENQVEEYKKMEQSIRDTLITAQKLVEEYKENAKREAELIVKEAELRAENIIREAQEKVVKIHEDIVDLKGIRRHFKEELRRLIESHLRMLEFDKEREGEESEI
ncbi:MAG: DivIVA domain-containing protein [Thermodesulfovibrio sp.]|nr:DivIVA domain-containing protein [Thermodesulfovibrio sp.]